MFIAQIVFMSSAVISFALKDFIVGTDVRPLTYAFRANDITAEDMKTICAINKIVLNSTFLETLLDKGE